MKISKINIAKTSKFFTLFFVFTIPLAQKISTILIFVVFFFGLFNLKQIKLKKAILLKLTWLPFLYMVLASSMLLNPPISTSIISMKLSLLVFPLIFILHDFSKNHLFQIFKYFIYGCIFSIFCCYVNAGYQSVSFHNGILVFDSFITPNNLMLRGGNYFFGKPFSIFHQSVYFSMYLNIALIGLLYLDLFSVKIKLLFIGLVVLGIFQISNKANIGIMILLFLFWFLGLDKSRFYKLVSVLAFCCLGASFLFLNPRTKVAMSNLFINGLVLDRESENSTGVRLLVWDAAMSVVKSNFVIGVGADNAYSSLKKAYKKKRYIYPFRNRLNAHNQFLQIIIECGLLGFILLFIQLLTLLGLDYKKQILWNSFLLIIMVNFLFEVVLNRYSGIMSYAFFYCLFVILKDDIVINVPQKSVQLHQ